MPHDSYSYDPRPGVVPVHNLNHSCSIEELRLFAFAIGQIRRQEERKDEQNTKPIGRSQSQRAYDAAEEAGYHNQSTKMS